MRWSLLSVCLVASAASAAIPVQGGNALTLPAQRHVVRVVRQGRGAQYLLALQQGGRQGRRLGLYRSGDGRDWRYAGALSERSPFERADLLAVGDDVALVRSIETPDSQGIPGSANHDVVFQWVRYSASTDRWTADRPLTVFDSRGGSTAYYRAELARDSRGRLWVQAFRKEPSGESTLVVAVSTDNGNTFRQLPSLAGGIPKRGGGRLISLGGRLLMLWGSHHPGYAARFRVRDDDAPLESWSGTRTAFGGAGIYHGAALSAVGDGAGGLHLVYKDNAERLQYRRFRGSSFSGQQTVLGDGDWATQPALTRVGDTLLILFNRPRRGGYDLMVRRLRSGSLGGAQWVGSNGGFMGYPAGVDVLPSGTRAPFLVGLEGGGARVGAFMVSPGSGASSTDEPVTETEGDVDVQEALSIGGFGAVPANAQHVTAPALPPQGCGSGTTPVPGAAFIPVLWWGTRRLRSRHHPREARVVERDT